MWKESFSPGSLARVSVTCRPRRPFPVGITTSALLVLLPGLPLLIVCERSRLGTPPSPRVILEIYFWCYFGVVGVTRGPGFVFSFEIKRNTPLNGDSASS